MATLKLKPARGPSTKAPSRTTAQRAPVRGSGSAPRPRPTLAQAQTERADRAAERTARSPTDRAPASRPADRRSPSADRAPRGQRDRPPAQADRPRVQADRPPRAPADGSRDAADRSRAPGDRRPPDDARQPPQHPMADARRTPVDRHRAGSAPEPNVGRQARPLTPQRPQQPAQPARARHPDDQRGTWPPQDQRSAGPPQAQRRGGQPDPRRSPERPPDRHGARPAHDARDPRHADERRGAGRPEERPGARPPDPARVPRPAPSRGTRHEPGPRPTRHDPAGPTPVAAARSAPSPSAPSPTDDGIRLSKRMSALGIASRREADEWIPKGWVQVDGRVVDQLGARVRPEQRITVDARARFVQAQKVTVLLHKPLGYVSGQAEDGHAPASVLVQRDRQWRDDASGTRFLPTHLRGLAPAGRLDLDSTGLLVLTQDGRIARQLIGEDSGVEKEYRVQVAASHGRTFDEAAGLALLRHGLELDGVALRPAEVERRPDGTLRIVLREGRKRQIRRMCEAVGLQVVALQRVRIGGVRLGDLPPGQWRYLRGDEAFAPLVAVPAAAPVRLSATPSEDDAP